jgi:hypothetical protein
VVVVDDQADVAGVVVLAGAAAEEETCRHCEYHGLEKTHVQPAVHVVPPVQPWPPPGTCQKVEMPRRTDRDLHCCHGPCAAAVETLVLTGAALLGEDAGQAAANAAKRSGRDNCCIILTAEKE